MHWVVKFAKYSNCLNTMSFTVYPFVQELVFSCRDSQLSVCVVFTDIDALQDVIGNVPSELQLATTNRYGVDLESIETSKLRLYCDGQADDEMLRSYAYNESKQLIESKIYKRSIGQYPILIDRYNPSGTIISSDEPEYSGSRELWTGPSDLIDTAEGHDVIYLRKQNTDQCYMRIMK